MKNRDKAQPGRLSEPCILIVNVHSMQNAGDAALLLMNIAQLKEAFEQPRFLVSANYPDEAFFSKIPDAEVIPSAFNLVGTNQGVILPLQVLRLLAGMLLACLLGLLPGRLLTHLPDGRWLRVFRAFRQADLVVAVSGNQFLSMGRYGWPFPITAFPVWMAHLYRKPFYVMPQSIGPFRRVWERRVFRWLYSRAQLVFLRDETSLDLARELGLPQARVRFAPDPAFALEAAGHEEAQQILGGYGYHPGQLSVGVTVIAALARTLDQQAIQRMYQDLATVLDRFVQTYGAKVFIFSQVTGPTQREDDRMAGRQLLSYIPRGSEQVVLVEANLSPMQLKACYGCMNLMVASRLHSGIFAMGAGVATILIGYFSKSRGLMRSLGMEEWLLELGRVDTDQIWEMLSKAWIQRATLAEVTRRKAEACAADVFSLGALVREDFNRVRA